MGTVDLPSRESARAWFKQRIACAEPVISENDSRHGSHGLGFRNQGDCELCGF